MATYSQSITGSESDSLPFRVANETLPDTSALPGGEQAAMRNNTPLLCKGPDGSLGWYTIDPEFSIPGVRRVLRAV